MRLNIVAEKLDIACSEKYKPSIFENIQSYFIIIKVNNNNKGSIGTIYVFFFFFFYRIFKKLFL